MKSHANNSIGRASCTALKRTLHKLLEVERLVREAVAICRRLCFLFLRSIYVAVPKREPLSRHSIKRIQSAYKYGGRQTCLHHTIDTPFLPTLVNMYNTGYHRPGPPAFQAPVPAPDPRYRTVPAPFGYSSQPPVPPGADPKLWQWFANVDEDRSGSITVTELQSALVNGKHSLGCIYAILRESAHAFI